MAKKQVDLKAAKAARQKKLAIGGALLLVAVLVFQVPRTLKMIHPSATPPVAAATTTTTATETTPTTPTAGTTPSIPVSNTAATVLTAQLAPPAREGQLSVLSASFKSKDPFRQLIDETAPSDASPEPAPKESKPAGPELKVVPTAKAPVAATAPTAPAAPASKKVILPFLSAVISVNGVREGVDVKVDFPVDAPLFHLVSLTKKGAKISVAGGSLASGAPTVTLRRGKPVTLVNTADGTRYRLVLVSTSTAAAVPATTTDPSGSTTPTTTTPTQTTTTETTTTPTIGG
jgi:hypothetical protein